MRLIPVITAILVTVVLFYIVVERDAILAFAANSDVEEANETPESLEGDVAPVETLLEETNRIRVVAVHSQAQSVDSAVVLRGQTEASRQVDVSAETSGLMISTPLRKGAFVEEGQIMCVLDAGTRQASLAEAKARLSEARARVPEARARLGEAGARLDEAVINFNAASKLSEGGFASDTRVASEQASVSAGEAGVESAKSGVESAKAGIEAAEAIVAVAQKDIERLTVRAPFSGLLETDTAELGSLLNTNGPSGAHCATIIQLDPIKIVGFVPETEINRVTMGAEAGARLTTGQTVRGKVSFLSRSADPTTRTFRVEISVPNSEWAIRDGQTAEILISSTGTDAHLIPQSALTLNDDGKLGVRIIDDNSQALFTTVFIVRDSAKGIWVTGLPAVSDVIIIGQEYVIDGVDVLPTFQEMSQ